MGSQLFTRDILARKDWPLLTRTLEEALRISKQPEKK
jgi:hypothetical protein